jgi:hypothetical protein
LRWSTRTSSVLTFKHETGLKTIAGIKHRLRYLDKHPYFFAAVSVEEKKLSIFFSSPLMMWQIELECFYLCKFFLLMVNHVQVSLGVSHYVELLMEL